MEKNRPFCCRCQEDFPVGTSRGFNMGKLTKLKYAPAKIKRKFSGWLDSELHGEGYLCGNCYFDLTD